MRTVIRFAIATAVAAGLLALSALPALADVVMHYHG